MEALEILKSVRSEMRPDAKVGEYDLPVILKAMHEYATLCQTPVSGSLSINKIETGADLPPYGKYVLVNGIDNKQYGIRRWHVCEMNDLEDGVEFKESGNFLWLTEKGTKIEDVTHWCELPPSV